MDKKVNIEQVVAKKYTEWCDRSVISYSKIVQKCIWGSVPFVAKYVNTMEKPLE